MNARVLRYTYDNNTLLFMCVYVCVCAHAYVNDYIWSAMFSNVYILSLVFLPLKLYMYCLI